jgi:putative ABC transport system permease protein
MRTVLQDVRQAWRGLRQTRGFTAMAVATLALGIAAATTMVSLLEAVILKPLPFREPGRLVSLQESRNGVPVTTLSAHEVLAWRDQSRSFDGIAAYLYATFNLTSRGEPQTVRAFAVSSNYFDVLGTPATLGRTFTTGEDRAGANRIAVLSERLWRQRFAADPSVVGTSIVLDNTAHRIVGVMRPAGELDPDLWVPVDLPLETLRRGRHSTAALGRLRQGITPETALRDLEIISQRLERELPGLNTGHGPRVVPLHEDLVGGVRRPLAVAAGAVGFVLLIACANVAHLLLTRGVSRQKEIAIRAALGATRARLARFLLVESALLGLLGGGIGMLLAAWIIDLLPAVAAVDIPRLDEVSFNARVVLLSLLISLGAGTLCGLVPSLRGAGGTLADSLGDRTGSTGIGPARLSGALALSEIALALVLLVGAALMLQSFVRLGRVNPGFTAENVLTLPVALPGVRYARPDQQMKAFDDLEAGISAVQGARVTGAVSQLPLGPGDTRITFQIEGRPAARPGEELRAALRVVTDGYFRTMEIPLREGRYFSSADRRRALPLIRWAEQQPVPRDFDEPQPPPVALINETMRRRFWPGEEAVGRRIRLLLSPPITIVGIVGDVRHGGLNREPAPEIYLSHRQEPQSMMTLLVRASGDPLDLAGPVRGQIRAIDRDLPVTDIRPMADVLNASLGRSRFETLLLGAFSGVALLLAMIGIYGVTSYAVGRRTREIGIRAALGATRLDVLRLVLGRSFTLTALGVAIGLAGALGLTRLLERLLFAIEPTDPWTFTVVALVLSAISLIASYIPARRALAIDPLEALKVE